MNPKVSIIVPVYNVEKYLPKCLDSLINQTLTDIEIVVVDDGSPDNCPMICDDYAQKDNRVKVVHKKNGGLSSARNEGLKYISGDFFMFVDSDDWLDLQTCEDSYNEIVSEKADCLMFSYTKEFGTHNIVNHIFNHEKLVWTNDEVKYHFHRRLFGPVGNELARPQNGDIIVSACMQLFKTEKFRCIEFVDTQKIGTEDCWYQILLYQNCDKFVYIDKPYYHYLRINDSSLTTKYNPNLYARWQLLYDYMDAYIQNHGLDSVFKEALQNRICLSVLGAGINQVHSGESILKGGRQLNNMLSSHRYINALQQLDTSLMPIQWKTFFFLAKHNFTFMLYALLMLIEYLRTHKRS